MFSIPNKPPISLTPRAVSHIKLLMDNSDALALRVGVKKADAGMEYTIEYVTELDKNDEVIEQDGVRVLIAPTAQMFLFGTEIDYETSLLRALSNLIIQMFLKHVDAAKVSNSRIFKQITYQLTY